MDGRGNNRIWRLDQRESSDRVKKTLQSLSPERNRSARRGPRKRSGPSCAQDARTYWYFGQNWRWRLLREIEILNSLHGLRLNYELKHPERRRVPGRFLQTSESVVWGKGLALRLTALPGLK